MARQTPQQKRANAAHSKQIEKNMGKPVSAYKKKDVPKSPISNGMLLLLIFVVAGTMGLGLSEVGATLWSALMGALAKIGIVASK